MNIYLHVEIASRELDSKILLAVRAAERGHDVLISDLGTITQGAHSGKFAPGIFHTKCLTPKAEKLQRHRKLEEKGFLVTSIDEEGGLVDFGYEDFAASRFSHESIDHAAAVFTWGPEDFETLKRIYPEYEKKFYCTGSSRVDLWQQRLASFWEMPDQAPDKPYVLVSSNFGSINNYKPFWERFAQMRLAGYFDRVPGEEWIKYARMSEEVVLFYEFLKAVEYLACQHPDLNIVVRPHPVEDPASWKRLLPQLKNLIVVREGSITPWVQNAAAVIHNGCTTALEATVAGTPVITYIPIDQRYGRELPNRIGLKATTQEELSEKITEVLASDTGSLRRSLSNHEGVSTIARKIRYDDELAADRMIDIWEDVGKNLPEQKNDWRSIMRYGTKTSLMIRSVKIIVRRLAGSKRSQKYNYKFPPVDHAEITAKINRLQAVVNGRSRVTARLVGPRSILIQLDYHTRI